MSGFNLSALAVRERSVTRHRARQREDLAGAKDRLERGPDRVVIVVACVSDLHRVILHPPAIPDPTKADGAFSAGAVS